jgi:dienelactone hydrolase
MKSVSLALMLALAIPLVGFAKVVGRAVEYKVGDTSLKGYLAYDTGVKGRKPGIVVVHEWWGLTEYPRMRARMLAKLGYVAFAADMFGDGKIAENPADAQKYAGESMKDPALLKAKFMAAVDYLMHDEHVDTTQIGAIGYCYGGGVVLNMADAGVDLKGVVGFHAGLASVTPPEKGVLKAKILVCAGGADKFITPVDIEKFKKGMDDAGADYKYIAYEGALHAFSNPEATAAGKKFNIPIAYNEKADKASWKDMQNFLKKVFKN